MNRRPIEPIAHPIDADVEVPGSKSLTNRALVLAALAEGTSTLSGALVADDTEAMAGALRTLGAMIDLDPVESRVEGFGPRPGPGPATIDARLSGTTSRFVLPLLALGEGPYRLDGRPPLRERPMGPSFAALRDLGARVEEVGRPGHLPVEVGGPLDGGRVVVDGSTSSQFTSGLLLAAPRMTGGLVVEVVGAVVARPFLDMTVAVLGQFGADATVEGDRRFRVAEGGLAARDLRIEPDASAASYFFAAALICGGEARVDGLGTSSLQGDARIVEVLAGMGAEIEQTTTSTMVRSTGELRGVDVDMAAMPDMAQTIAALAVFADGPTRIRGVEVIRRHETDRIHAVVTELARCGIEAEEHDDGFTVHPGPPSPATIETYDDHRMAMSFSLLGLGSAGIEIADPDCVAKTFPDFFEQLDRLRMPADRARG